MLGILDCRSQGAGHGNSHFGWGNVAPESLEFFDRPLLQHAVEQMVVAGVTHCVFITPDTSAITERWTATERWGCTFSAIQPHAVTAFLMEQIELPPAPKPAARPGARPRSKPAPPPVGRPISSRILVGRADSIPLLPRLVAMSPSVSTQLIFSERQHDGLRTRQFTGWAVTDPQRLLQYCFPTQGAEGLLHGARAEAIQVSLCIRSHTPGHFLRSQEAVLEAFQSSALVSATEIQPGIWAGRSVTLHPSATVTGPIYLAENVRIGKSVTLRGPLVIGRNSVVDMNADLEDVSVQPGVYVGKGQQRHSLIFTRSFLRAESTLNPAPIRRSFSGGTRPEPSKFPAIRQPGSFSNRSTG